MQRMRLGYARDSSLRLKNGSARNDALIGFTLFSNCATTAVAKRAHGSDNQSVKKPVPAKSAVRKEKSLQTDKGAVSATQDLFRPRTIVIVTLGNPREKFWGMILGLAPYGLSLSGIELASLEDFALMVKEGEAFTPTIVFFPMHRIERVELDLPAGNLPSLSQRFLATTGLQASVSLAPSGLDEESLAERNAFQNFRFALPEGPA